MLAFKNVSKSFGDIKAVKNVSFEVKKGEFVFIMGHSGAGKTTLLKMILREYLPDTGQILFEDQSITAIKPKDIFLLRQKIGVVFQDMKVLTERTVRENVEVGLAVIGVDQNEWQARVDQILKLVGLSQRAEHFPSQLSGGELQRVSLARALVVNPKLILADEPTGNLDWETSIEIMDLLEKVNKEGKTIIMATHNKMLTEKYGKRIIELKDGEVVEKGKTKANTKEKENEQKAGKIKVKVEEV